MANLNYIYIIASKQEKNYFKILTGRYIEEDAKEKLLKIDYSNTDDFYILEKIYCYNTTYIVEKLTKIFNSKDNIFNTNYSTLKKELLNILIEDIDIYEHIEINKNNLLRQDLSKVRIQIKKD